ncbi:MAG: type II and III secretion system protein [Magnetococcales bacterium]|nr:type II and III secretion system protein [Magnetococcales bacterium]
MNATPLSTPWLRRLSAGLLSFVVGCVPAPPVQELVDAPQKERIEKTTQTDAPDDSIPETVKVSPFLPKGEERSTPMATYTVVVTDVPVREVLFALARDANMNVDIVPGISGQITLNAIDQTLPRILDRIVSQSNIRYQIKENVLFVEPDLPFRRNYRVDYVTTSRKMESDVSMTTTVASSGANAPTISNSSSLKLASASTIDFWKNLIANLNEIVSDRIHYEIDSKDAKDDKESKKEKDVHGQEIGKKVIWNESTGVVSVLTTQRQHREVQEFIDRVLNNARRQVLIEATVAEVNLSDKHQSGIDWTMLKSNGVTDGGNRISTLANRISGTPGTALTLNSTKVPFLSDVLGERDIGATLHLLSSFGKTKVISSPRITVLNNQTAVLRVTTNEVYFEMRINEQAMLEQGIVRYTNNSETQIRTVPIGFLMQVTPQISESDIITLNIRPTIQRVDKWVENPDPKLRSATAGATPPQVPVVQVQEMDSILRVPNGHVAVMGGLMKHNRDNKLEGVPVLSELPVVGSLFSYRSQEAEKSELVVFLRPILMNEPRELLTDPDKQMHQERNQPLSPQWVRDRSIL